MTLEAVDTRFGCFHSESAGPEARPARADLGHRRDGLRLWPQGKGLGSVSLRNAPSSVLFQSVTGSAESQLVGFHCFAVIQKSK